MIKPAFDGRPAATAYAHAFRRFSALEGFDHQAVLRSEAGSILKTWAGETKVATADDAKYRARTRAVKRAFGHTNIGQNRFGISVNTGKRDGWMGMVWFRTRNKKFQTPGVIYSGGYFSQNHLHFKDDDWARIEAGAVTYANELKKILPIAEKSVGLARQSVIQIADDLNIDLTRVAGRGVSPAGILKARAAIASNGRSYRNGNGSEGGNERRYYVQLISRLPYGHKIGMDRGLASVLTRRAKYIETSYAKGAFDSMRKTSAAFPNFVRFRVAAGLS